MQLLPSAHRTLTAMLARAAERDGNRVLLRAGGKERTVAEMSDAAAGNAGALAERGVDAGDRVVLISENRIEVLELWLGCVWLGAILVPINPALKGMQLDHVLADAAPKLVVREDGLAQLAPGEPVPPFEALPVDPAAILYTSGTTGPSKGVICPHEQWYWWAHVTGEVLGVEEGDVLYTCLPLFHTNALNTFCQALLWGCEFVPGPRFSASKFWRRLTEATASVTYLLGPMVSILLRQSPSKDDDEHLVRIALAPATPAELHGQFVERFGTELVDAWGSTETNIVISNTHLYSAPGTLGRVREPFEARVADERDRDVSDGTPGELLVRSREPLAFARGYYNRPEETAEAWRGGWFHTGDRVVRNPDGRFRFVDRIKDVIRRRGENISAFEVEQTLQSHPDVAAAAVIPVPSDLGEDEVMACVVLREGAVSKAAALIEFCDERLAAFAVPRYVEFVTELPLTPSGKVEKYKLRERGITAATWDRERA